MSDQTQWHAHIPTDIDRPDPLIGPFTARQLVIVTPVILLVWAGFIALKDLVNIWVLAGAAVPIVGVAIALIVGQRDGISLDRLAWAGLAWSRKPKRRVAAPEGITELPSWAPPPPRQPRLEPLRLPASAITSKGVVVLEHRSAALIVCSTLNLALASVREQDTMVARFASVLHSLTEPVQILVRGVRFDLQPQVATLRENAPRLPHPALEDSAYAHADFLDELQRQRDLLQRAIVIVLTTAGTSGAAGASVLRRAEDVAAQLAGLGLQTTVCDGAMAESVLRTCLRPDAYDHESAPDHGDLA
ncbi:hypothetical protein F4561_005243 [Lipingzhangella halophila]|uniref:PrgI family protein n=1 Tax=Lipingzhangella halophila TaxID=1783352 RepID=A0A7W7W579_9ACTN|nr:PrgI family protein [Lipingzhangella halophila]MBB4934423.1 hypothetical protein [Lipingzhangella halophila]